MRRTVLTLTLLVAVLLSTMIVSVAADEPLRHTLRWGETLTTIARYYGVTVEDLVAANDLEDRHRVYVSQELTIPPPPEGTVVHTVAPGETLFRIAAHYGVRVADLVAHNNLTTPALLVVGQRLVIPTEEAPLSERPEEPPTAPAPILILEPALESEVDSPLIVSGWGRAPRNVLAVDVLDAQGEAIGQADLVIDAPLGDYGPFRGEVRYAPPADSQLGRVQVYSISPRDGAIEALASVTVTLR